MSKVQWKGGTLLAPVPATLVTTGTMEHPGILTVAWTGILCSDPPKTYISVRPSRYSHHLIRESGEFVINLTTAELARVTDELYGDAASDYIRAAELDDRKTVIEDRLLQLYEWTEE